MQIEELLARAKKQLAELTGLKPVTFTRAFKNEQGWHVGMEMLEMSRIPDSTDVLGEYEMLLGEDGNILTFERKRIRLRCEPMQEER